MAGYLVNKLLLLIASAFLIYCLVYSHDGAKTVLWTIPFAITEHANVGFQALLLQNTSQATPIEPENGAARAVAIIIHWLIVPVILLIIFLYALSLPYRDNKEPTKKSGTAGIFAGLIIFLIFVVTRPSDTYQFSSELPTYSFSFFSFFTVIIGFILGFVILEIIDAFRNTSKLAFLVMILVSASMITTYCYFLFVSFRSTVVFIALGGMLGGLIKVMIDPS
ncbi:MAG: hypothetical protein M3362_16335 [Acidobacteriota bacterium]|nr:hypothetical protein [Acidobacteriota bacterium]